MMKILIAEDEIYARKSMKKQIMELDFGREFQILEAQNGEQGLALFRQEEPDLVFTDIRMPGYSGLELLELLRKKELQTKVILISGYAEFEYAQSAIRNGAYDYLLKPIDQEKLQIVLERILGDGAGILENEQELVAPSTIRKIMDEIKEHYTENITLTGLAEKYAISVSYLSELLKEHLQLSFSEYISSKRIQKAKELLADESLSIEQIAEQTGYNDYFYFTKVFKKNTGISPSKYRKNLLEH